MPVTENRLTASADIRRIVQGERVTITVELFDEVSKQTLNVTGATAIATSMPGTDAAVTCSLSDGIAISTAPGRITVLLTAVKTAALKVGDGQAWQVKATLADGSVRIAQLRDAMDVLASLG